VFDLRDVSQERNSGVRDLPVYFTPVNYSYTASDIFRFSFTFGTNNLCSSLLGIYVDISPLHGSKIFSA
jgi:hypothetical protein